MGANFRIAAVALTAAVTAGCTAAPGGKPGRAFTRSDSAGVAIVTNFAITNRGDYSLDESPQTVIGNNSADSNQQFRRAPLAIRLPTGVVITVEEGHVAAFDRNGKFLRTLARRGQGPGELTGASRMIVTADTLIVRGGAKILRFSVTDLSLLREDRLECPPGARLWDGSAQCAFEFFSDGWAIAIAGDSTIPRTATNRPDQEMPNGYSSPGPGLLRQFGRIYAIPPTRDTAYPLGLYAGIEQFGIARGNGLSTFVIHPFYSRRLYYAANGNPRRFVVALNPEYNIEVWNDRGVLVQFIRRSNGRRVPTDEEKQAALKNIESQLEGEITVQKALSQMTVPDSLPAFRGLAVSPYGEVIVQTAGWYASDSLSVFDVFDADGVRVAEWKVPRRARIADIGDEYVVFTRFDDDDIPLVEVRKYRRK